MGWEWFDKLVEKVKDVIEWLGREETKEAIGDIVDLATKIIAVIGTFNDEPSNERKREYAWAVMKFMKYADKDTIAKMLELKMKGTIDNMEAYEMDAILGNTLAAIIKDRKDNKKS